jgi:hypothetical protein
MVEQKVHSTPPNPLGWDGALRASTRKKAWGPCEICPRISAKFTLMPMKEKLAKKLAFFRSLQPKCVGYVSEKK